MGSSSLLRFLFLAFSAICVAWIPTAQGWTSQRLINNSARFSQKLSASKDPAATTTVTPKDTVPTRGSIVTIECRLEPEGDFVPEALIDGVVLHANEAPATLIFGLHQGNYLPGLHDLVAGMSVGETVENVSLDAGWGAANPDLVVKIAYADSGIDKASVKPGTKLYLSTGTPCVVTATDEDTFTIDANPPLAGASYKATVKLLAVEAAPVVTEYQENPDKTSRFEVATFALGCFWGGELEYMREKGVVATEVGYCQGSVEAPSYAQVCSGTTGHTESILVRYDPDVVSYARLVELAMDRLGENKYLLNQVGNDRGTQYRHGVYYHTSEQKKIAEEIVGKYGEDCVTECKPATKWWREQEEYHQQYLLKGGQSARKDDKSVVRCYG